MCVLRAILPCCPSPLANQTLPSLLNEPDFHVLTGQEVNKEVLSAERREVLVRRSGQISACPP